MVVRTWLPVPNDPSTDIYGSPAREAPLLREIIRRVKTVAGVETCAIGNFAAIPLGHTRTNLNFIAFVPQSHEMPKDQAPLLNTSTVTPEYFQLMEVPLLRGRSFSELDGSTATQIHRARDLPPQMRNELLQSAEAGYPAGYEALLKSYYKALSQAEK